jgi:hypothetical protein
MVPFQDYSDGSVNPMAFRFRNERLVIRPRQSRIRRPKPNIRNSKTWIRTAFLLFFLCSFILSPGSLHAGELHLLEGNGIRLLFEPPHEPVARELIHSYPEVREELKRTFGWDLTLIPTVRLIRDSRQFQQWVHSPLTVAFALPRDGLVVIDTSRMKAHPFSLRDTFKHELCHLLLHQHIQSGLLPRWLDEGVAQWASDGAGDILLDQKRSVLNRVALRGRFIPLDLLTGGFPPNDLDLMLAYEESKSFIDYLIGVSGAEGVLNVLEQMKRGRDVEEAFLRAYRAPLGDLEKEWQRSLRNRITWFTYLSYHLYEILFVLAALMSIYGFIRIMIKKRRRMREEMEIEEL